VLVTGSITSQGGFILGNSATISSTGSIGYNNAVGVFIYGKSGSEADFRLYNKDGLTAMSVAAGTQNVSFNGNATFSNFIGVGGASATYPITAYRSANGTSAAFGGTTYGIRIDNGGTFSSGRSTIFGVDASFFGSYQPLSIEASSLALNVVTGGNVGIGTNTPASFVGLHINKAGNTGMFISNTTGNSGGYLFAGGLSGLELQSVNAINTESRNLLLQPYGGRVLIGTSDAGTDFTRTAAATAGANVLGLISTDNSSGAGFLVCRNSATSFIGGIARSGTSDSVSFLTSSDYRLKEDLKEIKGLEKVSAIKVYDFKWKDSDARMDGVLAHELAEVLPYAVRGEKDSEEMQSADYSKIVPVLVKAIQELKSQNDDLQSQINELKAQ
jgi:hypothetical protein